MVMRTAYFIPIVSMEGDDAPADKPGMELMFRLSLNKRAVEIELPDETIYVTTAAFMKVCKLLERDFAEPA